MDNCGQTYLNTLIFNSRQVVGPSKQTSTHTRVQCSHTSVVFGQAPPNFKICVLYVGNQGSRYVSVKVTDF